MFPKIFARHLILVKRHWELLWLFCLFSYIYVYMFSYIYTHTYVFIYIHTHRKTSKIGICLYIYTNTQFCVQVFCIYFQGETYWFHTVLSLQNSLLLSTVKWSDLSAAIGQPVRLSWLILVQKRKAENSKKGRKLNFFCSWLLLQAINIAYCLHTNTQKQVYSRNDGPYL